MPLCGVRWIWDCAAAEVAKLNLDDIDWQAGTITLRKTKNHREDVLPLPETTGQAIAQYLQFERPQTTNRAVFVRHLTPRGQAIGPDVVRQAIRQAYARAGLPYTGAHLCDTPWPVACWLVAVLSKRSPTFYDTARWGRH